ncbi:uncharacterized protein LOC141652492 [Silene latifolia]|uniref:uncharacterized protein LOC141652492 n=1 Tax=Silene latifolia TaxID=37657 RepID=UPI003D782BCE
MNILTWNIRGLNDPLKQCEVLDLMLANKVDVAAILETHVRNNAVQMVWQNKLSRFNLVTNNACHSNGRIWILWASSNVSIQVKSVTAQHIHCVVFNLATQTSYEMTFIYALNLGIQRMSLWDSIHHISCDVSKPWVCLGDFNVTLQAEERCGSHQIHYGDMEDFKETLEQCGLSDHPATGCHYTWTNRQGGSLSGLS